MPPKKNTKKTSVPDSNSKAAVKKDTEEFEALMDEFRDETAPTIDQLPTLVSTKKKAQVPASHPKSILATAANIRVTEEDRRNYDELLLAVNNRFTVDYVPEKLSKLQDGSDPNWHNLKDTEKDQYIKNSQKALQVQNNAGDAEDSSSNLSIDEVADSIYEDFQDKLKEIIGSSESAIALIKEQKDNERKAIFSNQLSQIMLTGAAKGLDQEDMKIIMAHIYSNLQGFERMLDNNVMEKNLEYLITQFSLSAIISYGDRDMLDSLIARSNIFKASQQKYSLDSESLWKQFMDYLALLNGAILFQDRNSCLKFAKDKNPFLKEEKVVKVHFSDKKDEPHIVALNKKHQAVKKFVKTAAPIFKSLNENRKAAYKKTRIYENTKIALAKYEVILGYSAVPTQESDVETKDEHENFAEAFPKPKVAEKSKNGKQEKLPSREAKESSLPELNEIQRKTLSDFLQNRAGVLPRAILDDQNINREILVGIKRSYEAVENIYLLSDNEVNNLLIDNEILTQDEYKIFKEACLTQILRNFFKGQIFSVDQNGKKQINRGAKQMADLLMHNPDSLSFEKKQEIANIIKTAFDSSKDLTDPDFINDILPKIKIKDSSFAAVNPNDRNKKFQSLEQLFGIITKLKPYANEGGFSEYDLACANLMNELGLIVQGGLVPGAETKFLRMCKDYRDFVSHGSDSNFAVRIQRYDPEGYVIWQKDLEKISTIPDSKKRDSELQKFYLDYFKAKISDTKDIRDLIKKENLALVQNQASR